MHVGVSRKGGTTPASQEALRAYLFAAFRDLLEATAQIDLLILGDLFDEFEVAPHDWLPTYHLLREWLVAGNKLRLVAGNHDNSPRGNKISAFTMLAQVLKGEFGEEVQVFDIGQSGPVPGGWVIAHCANQDLFNAELDRVLALPVAPEVLYLHANYDNNFAVEADHSLNVSRDVAKAIAARGTTLVFAHEHQAKQDLGGKVVVLGNQWPTSIADCLGNDEKFAHVFDTDVITGEPAITKVRTWDRGCPVGYTEVEWTDLAEAPGGFVRITGKATAAQASDVMNLVAAFRQRSDAFVVANAVQIEGIAEVQDLPAQFEATKAFDVLAFIKQHLDADEIVAVEALLKD